MKNTPNPARRPIPLAFAALGILLASHAAAQCDPDWILTPGFHFPGVDGNVLISTTWDPDGAGPEPERLVIGGMFNVVQDTPAAAVAAWDGESWDPLDGGVFDGRIFERVSALAVYDGMLIVGGHFGRAGDVPVNNIAAWDGQTWHALGEGIFGGFPEPEVFALEVHDGKLIAAGAFTETGSGPANFIAAWDGATWSTLGIGVSNVVFALESHGGDLYVGGQFQSAGNQPQTAHFARWDGAAWSSVGGGTNSLVQEIRSFGDDLYVGGAFTFAGGTSANGVANWTGSAWQALGTGTSGPVTALEIFENQLYVGGLFQLAGGEVVNNIARWDGAWHDLQGGTGGGNHTVWTLSNYGEHLFAGGAFRKAGDENVSAMALWGEEGWTAFSGRPLNIEPGKLSVFEGDLILTGFANLGGGDRSSVVVRWDGIDWSPIGGAFNEQVWDASVHEGGLYALGWFNVADGNPASGVARWDGAEWQGLGSGFACGYVTSGLSMGTYQNDLIVGGDFTIAGGNPANSIARWDGAAWHPLGEGVQGGLAFVWALVPFGADLIAAGSFDTAGGAAANNIARWDGAAWHPLGGGLTGGLVPEVRAALIFEGDLIVAGAFTHAGGIPSPNIARWDGAQWHAMGDGLPDQAINAITVYNGSLYGGAQFVFGQNDARLLRWTGSTWEPVGDGLNSAVSDFAPFESELVISGGFSIAGDNVAPGLARWSETHTPWFALQPVGVEACLGDDAQLTATLAAGYQSAVLQWRRGGQPLADGPSGHGSTISGSTTGTLTIADVHAADAGVYDLVADNGCASAASDAAELAVCAADFNCTGTVDTLDVLAFLNAWVAADTHADTNGDGAVNTLDVLEFLNAWAAGC